MQIQTPAAHEMPDVVLTRTGNVAKAQLATEANIQWLVDEMGFEPAYNMMTGDVTIRHQSITLAEDDFSQQAVMVFIEDMALRCNIAHIERVRLMISNIAQRHKFHPMKDWLAGMTWDGEDHIAKLIAAVHTDSELWATYIESWLIQTVHGTHAWAEDDNGGLPYVLTLVGGQGLGKTHLLRKIGCGWMNSELQLTLNGSDAKDSKINALRKPMAELSELDGTFRKSDMASLKTFISSGRDTIRAPYGRKAIDRPRMTSFCATVNHSEFLNDATGSRRFWPVMVDSIDWDADIDFQQVWAQAKAMWEQDPNFALSAEDEAIRLDEGEEFTHSTPDEELLDNYLTVHLNKPEFPLMAMNRKEIMEMLKGVGYPITNQLLGKLTGILEKRLGRHRQVEGKKRCWMVPYSGHAQTPSMWPKNESPKLTLVE